MIAQRIVAALLTILAFALIITGARALFRYLGNPAYGWPVGLGFCAVMVVAFIVQGRRERR